MSISELKGNVPKGFDSPTALPQTLKQKQEWQEANRVWWENHPMRYDFSQPIDEKEFTSQFYQEVDRRFFKDVESFLPCKKLPFDALIDFDELPNLDVLEIGIGIGSHAQLLASRARSYTGIDLTSYAVKGTRQRMNCFGISGQQIKILQMDAEKMEFEDNSFDFIWTWGVIHHSSDTRRILEQMSRVLRPGGLAKVMVYHRNFWNYYIYSGFFGGIIKRHLFKTRSFHQVRQQEIDGALARFYTIPEWKDLVSEFFTVEDVRILGSKTEIVPLPKGRLKNVVLKTIPDKVGRFLTNSCQMGTFLVSTLRK